MPTTPLPSSAGKSPAVPSRRSRQILRDVLVGVAAAVISGLLIIALAPVLRTLGQPAPWPDDYLNGVACPTPAQCWAVGQVGAAPGGDVMAESTMPLIEIEHGGRWRRVPAPAGPGSDNTLNAIACPAPRQCWAVGGANTDGFALIEGWAGGGWFVAPSPTVRDGLLSGISCPSATDCWAAGQTNPPGNGGSPVVEHWDGRRWARWRNPPDGLWPAAIACPTARLCWMIASAQGRGARNVDQLVDGRWLAPSHLPVSAPRGPVFRGFYAAACARGGSDCWAVTDGRDLSTPGRRHPAVNVVDHWDGRAWRPAAGLVPTHVVVSAVSCTGASCWLLGSRNTTAAPPVVLRWRNGRWRPARLAGERHRAQVHALACASVCWAVGGNDNFRRSWPLTAHVAGPPR